MCFSFEFWKKIAFSSSNGVVFVLKTSGRNLSLYFVFIFFSGRRESRGRFFFFKVQNGSVWPLWKGQSVPDESTNGSAHRRTGRHRGSMRNLEQIGLNVRIGSVENEFKISLAGHFGNIVVLVHHFGNVHHLKMANSIRKNKALMIFLAYLIRKHFSNFLLQPKPFLLVDQMDKFTTNRPYFPRYVFLSDPPFPLLIKFERDLTCPAVSSTVSSEVVWKCCQFLPKCAIETGRLRSYISIAYEETK